LFKMPKFSINDCVIYWDTRKGTSKQTKERILHDLTGLSDTIEKALQYLKDTAMDKKFPEVRFPIGENWEYRVFLHVYDGPDPLFYRLCIQRSNCEENIAEIENQTINIQTFISKANDEFYEKELPIN
jgi:hypothetical protein